MPQPYSLLFTSMASAPLASPNIFKAKPNIESSLVISGHNQNHIPRRNNGATAPRLYLVKAKASKDDKNTKPKSVICTDCDGNGFLESNERTFASRSTCLASVHDVSFNISIFGNNSSDFGKHGAILCSQCKGSGVNSTDVFNGEFKAGDSCWLCGGKKDMLCGNCNGAGFLGGFMSTFDE